MESWRLVWRDGVAPVLTVEQLEALRDGLREDDPRLVQGKTTSPSLSSWTADRSCERACAIGFSLLRAGVLRGDRVETPTVGEVDEHFTRVYFEADKRLGESLVVRRFLDWFDNVPRDEMLRELLPEVELAIVNRKRSKG